MSWEGDISPAMLLEHMRAVVTRLRTDLRKDVQVDIQDNLARFEIRMNEKFQKLESRLTLQIDGIDKRLDVFEIQDIPGTLKKHDRRLVCLERGLLVK